MTLRVLKWPVPVDDREHPIGDGTVLHVGCQGRNPQVVYVWTLEPDGAQLRGRAARVFGTGQPLPEYIGAGYHLGSVIEGALVWHVFQVTGDPF